MKSSSAQTTRVPGASDAATTPTNADTCVPTETSSGATFTRRANSPRATSTCSFQTIHSVRPWRHSSATAVSASDAGRGGNP